MLQELTKDKSQPVPWVPGMVASEDKAGILCGPYWPSVKWIQSKSPGLSAAVTDCRAVCAVYCPSKNRDELVSHQADPWRPVPQSAWP